MKVEDIINKLVDLQEKLIKKQSELDEILQEYQRKIEPISKEVKVLEADLEAFRKEYIPNVSIIEVNDKTSGKRYVRGSVRYYEDGSNRQKITTIHLGKLSDYPFGLKDDGLLALAQQKSIELIIKKKGGKK